VLVPVTALETTGYYVVQWDVVQEDVTWFGWEGQPPASTLLTVIGRAAGAADGVDLPSAAEEEQVSRSSTGSRERGRLWLWRLAGAMFMERPLFGVGPDGFRWQHGPHAGLADADERVHANNLYVEWLVDTGLVGFAAFLWMTWRLARAAWPSFDGDRGESEKRVWQAAVGASLTAWFVHGGVDFFYAFTPTYVAFALLCGLALAGSPGSGAKGRLCASDST
jgi:O-antigen ligase